MQFIHKKIDYTSPSGHEGGPGMGKQWTPYVGTPFINMSAATWQLLGRTNGAQLGATWTLGGQAPALGGNTFMFVQTKEALTLGQVVSARPPTLEVDDNGGAGATAVTGAGTAVSPTTTTAICTTNIDNTSFPVPIGVNGDVDNWLFVYSTAGNAAGIPQLRRIKANSSSSTSFYTVSFRDELRPNRPQDQDVFDYVPLNAEPVAIIRPYHVVVCTATTTPVGIALGTVTAGNYTVIQIGGLANVLVDADGLNEGITTQIPAVTAAAGAIKGSNGAANLYRGGSCILPQYTTAVDVATGLMIPCYVNFRCQ